MRISRSACLVSVVAIVLGATLLTAGPVARPKARVGWRTDFAAAWNEAQRSQRPMIVHFHAHWCGPCRQMERHVLNTPELMQQLGTNFIGVKVDSDQHPELIRKFSIDALPSDIFIDSDGRVVSRSEGYQDKQNYLARLHRIDAQLAQSRKIRIAKNDANAANPPSRIDSRPAVDPNAGSQANPSTGQPPVQPKSAEPIVGLDQYSPVALSKWRKWRKGYPQYTATHQGVTYYMSSSEEWREFQDDPARFAPRLLGCDPVVLWKSDRAIPGSTQYGAYFDNELFLFANAESRTQFKKNPFLYTRTQHVLRADQIERTVLR